MAKWFFPSTFLLFLGNWIGQIALNWYAYQLNQNAMDLALINFFRLAPIFVLSLWAGSIADRYRRSTLIKLTVTSSMVITSVLTICVLIVHQIPMPYLYIYACLRGCMSAIETPVRQVVLPDISEKLSISKAVSYHSFLLNVCRSIGPAVAGFLIAVWGVPVAFIAQSLCYVLALCLCLPLKIAKTQAVVSKQLSLSVAWQYFKIHVQGRQIFITSFLIMAMGYSYTTMLPILTDEIYPNSASVFGTAMTMSAIGGILATLAVPYILQKLSSDHAYYLSSLCFGIALLLIYPFGQIGLFLMIFFVGLFGQFARTTNRIYFQNDIPEVRRGKILSVVMMDRGMIPLGAMLLSYLTQWLGITTTFLWMGGTTTLIAILGYLAKFKINGGKTIHGNHSSS
ncbi:MFS transporter [Staphylococcus lutrae]|uniref:MFS transporter n=1 Tax=Staphylococcus lutrae TaxID=155085 RepID=A0AAC9RNE8_9STAP|nr:MFS transporter [Staphylococcus lutrae]ARJ50331.1 MFS transporter [Staphylococcus lutrae]PNZ36562.1 MFS transporter [Staphylococcus lutrae]